MNEQSLHWDDLRIVQAIAEAGSLSGAGRRLGASHATVFRRLNAIERRLGVALFERSRTGYAPTPAGEDLAATASRVAAEVHGAERRVVGRDLRLSGAIRVTTTDTLLMGLLSPIFADFQRTHPEIVLEVAVSNQLFNLSQRDADVAVRPSPMPPEHLVGRRIGTIAQAIYACSDSAADAWVGPDRHLGYAALDAWMAEQGANACCRYRVDTMFGMLAAARDGLGRAVLPCYLADAEPTLTRLGEPIPELATDLWLLTHPDLRRVVRIRAFMAFVAEVLVADERLQQPHGME
ncbi:LysR family transcriptional regulator [Halomonas sp. MCCC 1A17488]|uniref:LysR family transcriptional regulator n=1 Tax=unclassified Halomonas TaxID=2609666 RepID=UPI0018D24D0E|nr:LysR family transcriptional regulator [Halomonas sp. SS10-MC5]MCE8016562.1 LysR family transcriptional regulator [Halomonas sp. MCCC 1A17488]MCG3239895.1 LysR family transcriptional regulator [Halomonas sp. MCCC 1A17488]QPP50211.1 LysR family transcriptional regulator [Halomonas sp. SS10-MC5]